ncbi:SMI1/KNR4 family protein [Deinococcus enclensis]|uniref:Cell wall assembly regulator SMI1 n=1 Tax=Deinococcus enclensis TaxID=1049582 RepID=A0ABT9MHA9_9DEIO|nr:SMI1/KNR4 family protein [Deinococcus enclensis]MDP9765983.1 cell wall assembly regulator SMI1 [Deinococcus enclensis]
MTLDALVTEIWQHPDCDVTPAPARPVSISTYEDLQLPQDVRDFYASCDGAVLFNNTEYPYAIVPGREVVPPDPAIEGECVCGETTISDTWVIIAHDLNGDKIALDLHPSRLGRCYDCFFGNDYQVIATSFTDFLTRLYRNGGDYPYWLKDDFEPLPDACDF